MANNLPTPRQSRVSALPSRCEASNRERDCAISDVMSSVLHDASRLLLKESVQSVPIRNVGRNIAEPAACGRPRARKEAYIMNTITLIVRKSTGVVNVFIPADSFSKHSERPMGLHVIRCKPLTRSSRTDECPE